MAVFGVGIDLVQVDRLRKALERWDDRFKQRVFTELEIRACAERKEAVNCFAVRFAAKEAFAKALGTGMRFPVLWLDIETRSNPAGKPEIFLSPRAREYCRERGINSWHLSLTDDGQYGAAVVVIERD